MHSCGRGERERERERERESYPPYQITLYSQRHFFVSLFLCLFTGQSFPLILGVLIFVETTYRKLAGIQTTQRQLNKGKEYKIQELTLDRSFCFCIFYFLFCFIYLFFIYLFFSYFFFEAERFQLEETRWPQNNKVSQILREQYGFKILQRFLSKISLFFKIIS